MAQPVPPDNDWSAPVTAGGESCFGDAVLDNTCLNKNLGLKNKEIREEKHNQRVDDGNKDSMISDTNVHEEQTRSINEKNTYSDNIELESGFGKAYSKLSNLNANVTNKSIENYLSVKPPYSYKSGQLSSNINNNNPQADNFICDEFTKKTNLSASPVLASRDSSVTGHSHSLDDETHSSLVPAKRGFRPDESRNVAQNLDRALNTADSNKADVGLSQKEVAKSTPLFDRICRDNDIIIEDEGEGRKARINNNSVLQTKSQNAGITSPSESEYSSKRSKYCRLSNGDSADGHSQAIGESQNSDRKIGDSFYADPLIKIRPNSNSRCSICDSSDVCYCEFRGHDAQDVKDGSVYADSELEPLLVSTIPISSAASVNDPTDNKTNFHNKNITKDSYQNSIMSEPVLESYKKTPSFTNVIGNLTSVENPESNDKENTTTDIIPNGKDKAHISVSNYGNQNDGYAPSHQHPLHHTYQNHHPNQYTVRSHHDEHVNDDEDVKDIYDDNKPKSLGSGQPRNGGFSDKSNLTLSHVTGSNKGIIPKDGTSKEYLRTTSDVDIEEEDGGPCGWGPLTFEFCQRFRSPRWYLLVITLCGACQVSDTRFSLNMNLINC